MFLTSTVFVKQDNLAYFWWWQNGGRVLKNLTEKKIDKAAWCSHIAIVYCTKIFLNPPLFQKEDSLCILKILLK